MTTPHLCIKRIAAKVDLLFDIQLEADCDHFDTADKKARLVFFVNAI